MANSQSSSYFVDVRVNYGCVLAPIIFNLSLVNMTPVFHRDLQLSGSVEVEYRINGGLFNLRHLQSKTKTFSAPIFALQYTNDATFPSLTADGLQSSLDVISRTYLRGSFIVNTTKTNVLSTSLPNYVTFSLTGSNLIIKKISSTWTQISHLLVT